MRARSWLGCACLFVVDAGCSLWVDTDVKRLGAVGDAAPTPICVPECDDQIACTIDRCSDGACTHEVSTAACPAGFRCDPQQDCVEDSVCDDVCGCDAGACADCAEFQVDRDGDGHFARVAAAPSCGDDCDDQDRTVYPDARELCDALDNDCDGTIDEGCASTRDLCRDAPLISIRNNQARLSGSFASPTASFQTACAEPAGLGAVFRLEVSQLSDIELDTSGSSVPTVLAVGTNCAPDVGFNLACANPTRQGRETSRLVIHRYDPSTQARTLYVLVDAFSPRSSGEFVLDVRVEPTTSYTCGAPLDLSEGGTLFGFMTGSGALQGSCMPLALFNSAESVVRYTASEPTSLRCQATSSSFAPALYAQTFCGSGFSELDCQASGGVAGTATLDLRLERNQTAFVVVDNGKDGGKYELSCVPRPR